MGIMGERANGLVRQIWKLKKGISSSVDFAELPEVPWQQTWWLQVVGFMHS